MMALKGPIISLMVFLFVFNESQADTKYFLKLNSKETQIPSTDVRNQTDNMQNNKHRAFYNVNDESVMREILKANQQRRNSFIEPSTFNPNVLNKFLDEYANKFKTTTDKSDFPYSYGSTREPSLTSPDDTGSSEMSTSTEDFVTINGTTISLEQLNDTMKRNKFYNQNHNDNRNGWVTLEAIPWSKSKISKWQANINSQRPWNDNSNSNNNNNNNNNNKWDKFNSPKPWGPDHSSRPPSDNNKSWYDKGKPQLSDFQADRVRPSTRPSYTNNRYDSSQSQAQKWPPEKPSSPWDDFSNAHRPHHSDIIITDDRPSNFPVSDWDKYDQITRPTYSSSNDRYDTDSYEEANNNWPVSNNQHKFDNYDKPSSFVRPNRPHFSGQYEYENHYPPSHPSSGDGQWILLSTNHGYSRQRSLKHNSTNSDMTNGQSNGTVSRLRRGNKPEPAVEVVTSKRQVRLTVLPSINGTNTTTSHGGLLEVEKTFKTVEESRKEYEAAKLLSGGFITNQQQIIKTKKPVTRGVMSRPSNGAVLAAVGAGMLPATMAMMLPIMLGRKKRSLLQDTHIVMIANNRHQ